MGYPAPLAAGTWDAVSYDPATFQTTLVDAGASWTADHWAGRLVRPSDQDPRWLHVADNDATALYLWGDHTAWVLPGDAYAVYDLRLQAGSPAVDRADDACSTPADRLGQPRVDVPGVGISTADMGAYEYQP